MPHTIDTLYARRDELLTELCSLEEFRRGSISVNYRKCGKSGCWCNEEGSQGHGPQYLWTTKVNGKSVSKNLRLGPELEKCMQETERYKRFTELCESLLEVNEQLCDNRPVREIESDEELESLKKKLQRQLLKKHRKR